MSSRIRIDGTKALAACGTAVAAVVGELLAGVPATSQTPAVPITTTTTSPTTMGTAAAAAAAATATGRAPAASSPARNSSPPKLWITGTVLTVRD
jgi:hypothetical protein